MLLALTPDSAPQAVVASRPRSAEVERTLMDAIRSGDERLAAQVYAGLLPSVSGTLGRVLGVPCRGREQLTQRSLELAITEICRHASPWVCKLEIWACASAARIALEVLRHRANAPGAEVAWGDTMAQTSGDDRSASPGSAIDRLRWLLAELPPQQAEAVVLCDVMGLVPTEVAVVLGVGLEHVRRLLAAGHERLSRALS